MNLKRSTSLILCSMMIASSASASQKVAFESGLRLNGLFNQAKVPAVGAEAPVKREVGTFQRVLEVPAGAVAGAAVMAPLTFLASRRMDSGPAKAATIGGAIIGGAGGLSGALYHGLLRESLGGLGSGMVSTVLGGLTTGAFCAAWEITAAGPYSKPGKVFVMTGIMGMVSSLIGIGTVAFIRSSKGQ